MTDDRVRDLLRDAVSDVTGPDLADSAWRSGVRGRRRRTASVAVASVAAVTAVVGVAGVVAIVDHDPSGRGPVTGLPSHHPTHVVPSRPPVSPGRSTYRPSDPRPDARYAGWPVWWAPTLADEQRLPAYPDSPLPATIALADVVGPLADHPLPRAVAAFGVSTADGALDAVDVLGADGRLRSVDASRPQPMADPAGGQRVRVGPSLLSRSGEYLLFPQEHSVLLYTLATGQWRTVATGSAHTWDATWITDQDFVLPDPAHPLAQAPQYSVDGRSSGSTNVIAAGRPGVPLRSSQGYGRARTGQEDIAQAFSSGAPIPEPPRSDTKPGGSDWVAITGADEGILLVPTEPGRQMSCCQVDGWIGPHTVMYDSSSSTGTRLIAWTVGTGRFWQVSQVTGVAPGEESVSSSYAQFPGALAPNPR